MTRQVRVLSAVTSFLDRCGKRLDRRRIAAGCATLLAIEIAAFAFFAAGTHGLVLPLVKPTSTDFVSFYAAGTLANAGTPELVYDRATHFAAEQQAAAPGIRYNYFYYPPIFVLLCAILARLPYLAAFVLFEAGGLALFLWAMVGILGERRWTALLPVLAFPAMLWNIGLGQNAFVTAALFGAATLLIDRRPALAGALFGALCYKPPFGLLIPVALAAAGRWRAFAAAAASLAALVLLSLAWFGPATWDAFFRAARDAGPVYEGGVKLAGYVTPFGAVRVLGLPPALAYAVQGLTSLTAIAGVWFVWARGVSLPVRAAALCAATLVATPFIMWYDLVLASVAAAWLYAGGKLAPADSLVLAVLSLLVLDPPGAGKALHLPIGALCAMLFVALVARIAWREAARRAGRAEIGGRFGTAMPAAPD
ncbi:MAG TPA: glycosyltransferase family 87 protein [Stellaceae bacterium]|nr:glycosyltransferase family 87 protein [Stellaceae bacterium]